MCDHCKTPRHVKETCFKLNGYSDWYIELLKNKKEKTSSKQVNMAESTADTENSVDSKQQEWMIDFIKQEKVKIMKGKQLKTNS